MTLALGAEVSICSVTLLYLSARLALWVRTKKQEAAEKKFSGEIKKRYSGGGSQE